MRNNLLSLIFCLIGAGFLPIGCLQFLAPEAVAASKLPVELKISTDEVNEYWYYIQNSLNYLADSNDNEPHRVGYYISSRGNSNEYVKALHLYISGDKALQLWKIVQSPVSGQYFLVNKATKNKLGLGSGTGYKTDRYYTTSVSGTPFAINLCEGSNDYVTLTGNGGSALLGAWVGGEFYNGTAPYNTPPIVSEFPELPVLGPRGWIFIPETEVNERYPSLSTETEAHWYHIKSVTKQGQSITDNAAGNTLILTEEADIDSQWWKFVKKAGASAICDSVYIINKATGRYLNGTKTSTEPMCYVLQHLLRSDVNQFRLIPSLGKQGISVTAEGMISATSTRLPGGWNSDYAFRITKQTKEEYPEETEKSFFERNIDFAAKQTKLMVSGITSVGWNLSCHPVSGNASGGRVLGGPYDWRSGFFSGNLWYLYELTGNSYWKNNALKWTHSLEGLKTFTGNHDLGFMVYCSFGNANRLDPSDRMWYESVLVESAQSLSRRYNSVTQCIESWNSRDSWHVPKTTWQFPVIIDNMMNLELLFAASKISGNSAYYDIAVNHANKTMENHVRADYGSYHVVDYDTSTGAVKDRATCQGYSDNSTWARGQAWGIYGFTMVYRETKDPKYLTTACGMVDYFLNHPNLPEDMIPYWDFNVGQPGYVNEWPVKEANFPKSLSEFPMSKYRDASAGAIVASALFELYEFTKKEEYLASAIKMIESLASPEYQATYGQNGNFILKHSVGSIPHGGEIDVPLVYADYYFLEALLRYQKVLQQSNEVKNPLKDDYDVWVEHGREIHLRGDFFDTEVSVYDIQGTKVYSNKFTGGSLQIGMLSKGMYILKIGNKTQKIII